MGVGLFYSFGRRLSAEVDGDGSEIVELSYSTGVGVEYLGVRYSSPPGTSREVIFLPFDSGSPSLLVRFRCVVVSTSWLGSLVQRIVLEARVKFSEYNSSTVLGS